MRPRPPALLMAALAAASACYPELGSDPTGPDDQPPPGGWPPITLAFEGDTTLAGFDIRGTHVCRVRLDARVQGGGGGASLSWGPVLVTFRDPGPGEAMRSRSGRTAEFVAQFFGLRKPQVAAPSELEGGPFEFGDSQGRSFVLELEFTYTTSDASAAATKTWRARCE